jgi:hypothetical protein
MAERFDGDLLLRQQAVIDALTTRSAPALPGRRVQPLFLGSDDASPRGRRVIPTRLDPSGRASERTAPNDADSERRAMATKQKQEPFAFPSQEKEPIGDAEHVRNAVARFNQVQGVSDSERDAAWRRIRAAARKFGVDIEARGWRSLSGGGKRRGKPHRQ